ncbi:MAG: SAM-dependent methyltransferase [Actinobacteria bacterium]|nr:SAM-dependent methyltransferase [Actinomycetota bacterium]
MRTDAKTAQAIVLERAANLDELVSIILAGRVSGRTPVHSRVELRPVKIKGVLRVQFTFTSASGTTTHNAETGEALEMLAAHLDAGYANFTVRTTTSLWQCRLTKREVALTHEQMLESAVDLRHDRPKRRMLEPADPVLRAVGISDGAGKIKPSMYDKYRQVDEFVRIFAATVERAITSGTLREPTEALPLRIVDLGCGYAYLTFAVMSWATHTRGWPIEVVGVDRRAESVARNQSLADSLGAHSMTFVAANISDADVFNGLAVSVVLALHACDTATDDALAWAVRRQAGVVLAAPCCHHNVQAQLHSAPEPYGLLTRFDVLKERFGDVLTDALRAAVLRQQGYRVDVIEFIGGEHTARNILIRAVHTGAEPSAEVETSMRAILGDWEISLPLEHQLNTRTSRSGSKPKQK